MISANRILLPSSVLPAETLPSIERSLESSRRRETGCHWTGVFLGPLSVVIVPLHASAAKDCAVGSDACARPESGLQLAETWNRGAVSAGFLLLDLPVALKGGGALWVGVAIAEVAALKAAALSAEELLGVGGKAHHGDFVSWLSSLPGRSSRPLLRTPLELQLASAGAETVAAVTSPTYHDVRHCGLRVSAPLYPPKMDKVIDFEKAPDCALT